MVFGEKRLFIGWMHRYVGIDGQLHEDSVNHEVESVEVDVGELSYEQLLEDVSGEPVDDEQGVAY